MEPDDSGLETTRPSPVVLAIEREHERGIRQIDEPIDARWVRSTCRCLAATSSNRLSISYSVGSSIDSMRQVSLSKDDLWWHERSCAASANSHRQRRLTSGWPDHPAASLNSGSQERRKH